MSTEKEESPRAWAQEAEEGSSKEIPQTMTCSRLRSTEPQGENPTGVLAAHPTRHRVVWSSWAQKNKEWERSGVMTNLMESRKLHEEM